MAFRFPAPPTTTTTIPPGTVDRTRSLVAPPVPAGGTVATTPESKIPQLVLPASAGLFGGIQPESTKAAEKREQIETRVRQMTVLNPPTDIRGPLIAPNVELGLPQPMGEMPVKAAAIFRAALAQGRVSP